MPEGSPGRIWVIGMIVLGMEHPQGQAFSFSEKTWKKSLSCFGCLMFDPAGLIILPSELAAMSEAYYGSRANGGRYSRRRKHVVLLIGQVTAQTIQDFLEEFYAEQETARPFTVILLAGDQTREITTLLKQPRWATKSQLLLGSALVKVTALPS